MKKPGGLLARALAGPLMLLSALGLVLTVLSGVVAARVETGAIKRMVDQDLALLVEAEYQNPGAIDAWLRMLTAFENREGRRLLIGVRTGPDIQGNLSAWPAID
ncbi:MAG: hypothetical protein V2I43_28535, partial [Parvularcula sp.]|nr:hypothetical protein [Parvularcula sp.]